MPQNLSLHIRALMNTLRALTFLCTLFVASPALAQSLPLPPPRSPIPGTGSGGAYGPIVGSASESSTTAPNGSTRVIPPPTLTTSGPPPLPPAAPLQIHSNDATYFDLSNNTQLSPDETVNSSFTVTTGAIDLGGATDGNHIVTTDQAGNIGIYTMAGSPVASTSLTAIACPGLPLCGNGGYVSDARVIYDSNPGSGRWTFLLCGPRVLLQLRI